MERVEDYLDALEAELRRIYTWRQECHWELWTTGYSGGLEESERTWRDRTQDLLDYERLTRLRGRNFGGILGRRIFRLWQLFRDAPALSKPETKELQMRVDRLEREITQIHTTFRPTLRGRKVSRVEISRIFEDEEDRDLRREAWFASQAFGAAVENQALELVLLRNELAKELGYRNLYSQVFENQEGIKEDFLFDLLAKLESLTDEPHCRKMALLQDELGISDIQPWDSSRKGQKLTQQLRPYFLKEGHLPKLVATLRGVGIEWENLSILLDVEEREGKSSWAHALLVRVPSDIRLLANLADGAGYCGTLFHEGGHCLHFAHVQPGSWILEAPELCFEEGMAEIVAGFIRDDAWQRKYAGLPEEFIAKIKEDRWKGRVRWARWYIELLTFERELFTNPHQDLNDLWWRLEKRLFGLPRPVGECSWANILHFSTKPVCMQNYFIAGLIRAHTYEYLRRTQGSIIDNPATGRFLIENYYRPGDSKPWRELIKEATGEGLNPQYFVDELLRDIPK